MNDHGLEILVMALCVGFLCFIFGAFVAECSMEADAIEAGHAHYSPVDKEFTWGKLTPPEEKED